MYRWQTLTLAKLEANAKGFKTTVAQIQAAKKLLLDIGLQHFLEPSARYDFAPSRTNSELTLVWEVDGRELRASIQPSGQIRLSPPPQADRRGMHGSDASITDPSDAEVQDAVQRLLFEHTGGFPITPGDKAAYLEAGLV